MFYFETLLHQALFGSLFDRSAIDNICLVFMVGCDWLVCQKVRKIQILPDVVKFQTKGFEIKLTVAAGAKLA